MSWKRTLIKIGGDDEPDDGTTVSYEDSMTMITTTVNGEELEIIIAPWLYPQLIEHMRHWDDD